MAPGGIRSLTSAVALRLPVYAAGGVAGAVAARIGIPLPWMLGPFFVFAILSASGLSFALLPYGREMAQITVGLAIGLRFTAASVVALSALLPQMVAATLYLICVTTLAAFLFRRLAGVDPVTAFFATAAGGVADMAIIAKKFGGVSSSIAVVHAMRVSMVVAVTPFVVLVSSGGFGAGQTETGISPLLPVFGALGFATLVAVLLRSTPIPNPWLVGPIIAGMILGVSGLGAFVVPGWMITVAQILLGVWLGCQFRRNLLTALPRVTAAALVTAGVLVLAAVFGAWVMSGLSALPFTTAFLALAPAAVTEMVLTAKVMNLDAETVAAFHVMRILIVSSTILLIFRLYNSLRGARDGS
ncbi:AbrB family transcriptional regulator [Yoonia sp.]|uniref:AbrB family transcriptional regulator n=1 Tax=Yoonia sp. TaxID=2212373 RepID=UPI00391B9205